jgi:tungstate transport system permease protein
VSVALQLTAASGSGIPGIIALSLAVSGTSVLIGGAIGIPLGVAVGLGRFRFRRLLISLIYTGFALPPVVVGLFVYLLLSRDGPAGGLGLLFTPTAMILAQTVLATPFIAGITLAAVQAVPADVRHQARGLGASPALAFWMHVREARLGLVAALIAGFGAAISEVGAVMLVGGNIAGETRVLTTSILLETRRGSYATALALAGVLLVIAFVVNALLTRVQQGPDAHRPRGD